MTIEVIEILEEGPQGGKGEAGSGSTPAGGSTDQVLKKLSDSDFDVGWGNEKLHITKRVVISSVDQFPVTLDSSVQYFIDGVVDLGTRSLEIPAGGLHLAGLDLELSFLISSEDNYTMFTSPVGGSGNLLGDNFSMSVTGVGSQVYDIVDATGLNAIEFGKINYTNCTSLGVIANYRQGLETGSGRFGGSPSLTLKGPWLGGFRITTSIVRQLDAGMTEPLFKAGVGFVMQSRFLTDMNVDLPPLAPLSDFAPSNFPNSSTLQLQGVILTRAGVFNSEDANLLPNIDQTNLASYWIGNQGLQNTHVGGHSIITSEVVTPIAAINTFAKLEGARSYIHMQHFDSPDQGELRHLGRNPREFTVVADKTIVGAANKELTLRLRKWNSSTSSFTTESTQRRTVNNLSGGRDVAFFNMFTPVTLGKDDYVFFEVANASNTDNVTAELDSFFVVQSR